jgi:predicted RNase H-like nuclease (RuvC/YqgF family)
MNEIVKYLKFEIEQLKTDISKLKKEIEELKNPIIKLKEMTNSIINTYALFTTDKDVNILFINYERFQNEPKLYKLLEKLEYNYKVYLNKKNEIQFATDDTGKTVVGISEENFENFEILREIFL